MDVQRRYWQELSDLKRDARYIDLYHARTERTDRWLSILAAVTSSASIGAWAVWQHLGPAWAFIIAASQVLSAVKEHLPYSKRLKALGALSPELVYRPRLVGHLVAAYAARAAVESWSWRTASGGLKPCRSMSRVGL